MWPLGRQRQRVPEDGLRLRASESRARQVAQTVPAARGVRLEQVSVVLGSAEAAASVVAGGPAAGGVAHSQGQRGGARPVFPRGYRGSGARGVRGCYSSA